MADSTIGSRNASGDHAWRVAEEALVVLQWISSAIDNVIRFLRCNLVGKDTQKAQA